MGTPVVTRECTPRACRNSRKPMRLPTRHEMRPDSPALHAEQLCFPNQTHKEPRFAWLDSRKSPTTLSQDEKNTDVSSGTQNWLVYPKSTQDEAHFPFIESIAVSDSTSYKQVSWHPLQESRDSLRHLLYMMWNQRRLWIQWRENVLHLELICGTPINFAFLRFICNNTNGPQGHYATWNKTEKDKYHMISPICGI